jgi:hypothetical protein
MYISCRRWTFIQYSGFYFVLCSFELNIDTHTYLYIQMYILSNMTNNWFVSILVYVTVNLTLIQGKYLCKKKISIRFF